MDLGFSTHAYHSSSRLVFMEATLSPDRSTLSILSPPNNRVFPPGPGALGLSVSCFVWFLFFSVYLLDDWWGDERRISFDGWKWGFATRSWPGYISSWALRRWRQIRGIGRFYSYLFLRIQIVYVYIYLDCMWLSMCPSEANFPCCKGWNIRNTILTNLQTQLWLIRRRDVLDRLWTLNAKRVPGPCHHLPKSRKSTVISSSEMTTAPRRP